MSVSVSAHIDSVTIRFLPRDARSVHSVPREPTGLDSPRPRPRGSGPGRDEPVTPPMVSRACERTERESKAVGWRPLAVYGLCLGPRICGCCHAMSDVTVRVAQRCWLGRPGAQSTLQCRFGSEAAQFDDVGRGPLPSGAQQVTLLPGGEGRVDDNGLAKSQQLLGLVCQALVRLAGGLRGVDTLAKPCGHVLSRRDARQLFAHTVTGQRGCGNRVAQTLSKGGLA